jgi:L-amino acid N-acyltransferase
MEIILEPIQASDAEAIVDIFNYYTENSFAAYTERTVPYDMFDAFFQTSRGYPSVTARGTNGFIVGFGMLRPYSAIPAFCRTAELTCFLRHGYTGQGTGRLILEFLEENARAAGITSILASISSLNGQSIRFHLRNGFQECGRFRAIGMKKGVTFDVVYFQKII